MSRFFVRDEEYWENFANTPHRIQGEAQVRRIPNAVLLPLIKDEATSERKRFFEGVFKGGVCDADLRFVTGRKRRLGKAVNNFDCNEAYEIDDDSIPYKDETVVFGGIVVGHFGHMLLDFASRLWYVARHPECKVVCLRYPESKHRASYDGLKILDLMGVPKDKIEVVNSPTRYKEVIVPEEAMIPLSGYKEEYIETFRCITSRIRGGSIKKLYLSRRSFSKETPASIINEEYFEDFFARRGFVSVCPETLSLEEQISLVSGAKEIVTTMGSMAHLLLFARPDVKAVILNRDTCIKQQIYIDQAAGIEPVYIDANSNPLPVSHNSGPFLLMPNYCFRRFLEESEIERTEEELRVEEAEKAALLYEFYAKWVKNLTGNPKYQRKVAKKSMRDVLKLAHDFVEDENSSVTEYNDADALTPEITRLRGKLREANAQLNALRSSKSWRITAPLRALGRRLGKR